MLKCIYCNEEDQSKFYPNRNRNKCIECYITTEIKRYTIRRKIDKDYKIELKECHVCKKEVTEHNTHHFEWNHRNPSEKVYNISRIVTQKKKYDEEIKKCDLLCLFCHADITEIQRKSGELRTKPRKYGISK